MENQILTMASITIAGSFLALQSKMLVQIVFFLWGMHTFPLLPLTYYTSIYVFYL